MTLDEIIAGIEQLDDQDFNALYDRMFIMREERRARPAVEQAKQAAESETATKIAQQIADEHPELVEKPAVQPGSEVREWEPWHPLRESTHYHYGDKTRHGGKVWRDVLDPTGATLNVWEPGAPGIDERYWVEETSNEPVTNEAAPGTADEPMDEPSDDKPGEDAPTVHEWEPGLAVKPGDQLTYRGTVYTVRQAHTTAAHWLPDALPALYQRA